MTIESGSGIIWIIICYKCINDNYHLIVSERCLLFQNKQIIAPFVHNCLAGILKLDV